MKNFTNKRLFILAITAITTIALTTSCAKTTETVQPTVPTAPSTSGLEQTVTDDTPTVSGGDMLAPMGARKYLELNQQRFAFIQDGETFELTAEQLGENLGTLTLMTGITIDENNNPQISGDPSGEYINLASSFADGGTVYALTEYNTDHRVAVEKDGKYYIAENVGNTDNSELNIGEKINNWELETKVVRVDIYNHMGDTLLRELPQDEASAILTKMATGMVNTTADYQGLATAQSNGQSFQLRFVYKDGTFTTCYAIPTMDHFSFGDSNGTAENFGTELERFFSGLSQDQLPQGGIMQ